MSKNYWVRKRTNESFLNDLEYFDTIKECKEYINTLPKEIIEVHIETPVPKGKDGIIETKELLRINNNGEFVKIPKKNWNKDR